MAKKNKIIPCIINSREAMESAVADVVQLKLKMVQMTAAMEAEVASVQQRHQEWILDVARQIEIKEAGVYLYCSQNRKELFPEKKSIELLVATVGFQTHPPSVEKIRSKETWGQIATRLASLPWGEDYVSYADPTVDKRGLIADRSKLKPEDLETIGIRIEQEESFYIEPKSQVATATVKAAA